MTAITGVTTRLTPTATRVEKLPSSVYLDVTAVHGPLSPLDTYVAETPVGYICGLYNPGAIFSQQALDSFSRAVWSIPDSLHLVTEPFMDMLPIPKAAVVDLADILKAADASLLVMRPSRLARHPLGVFGAPDVHVGQSNTDIPIPVHIGTDGWLILDYLRNFWQEPVSFSDPIYERLRTQGRAGLALNRINLHDPFYSYLAQFSRADILAWTAYLVACTSEAPIYGSSQVANNIRRAWGETCFNYGSSKAAQSGITNVEEARAIDHQNFLKLAMPEMPFAYGVNVVPSLTQVAMTIIGFSSRNRVKGHDLSAHSALPDHDLRSPWRPGELLTPEQIIEALTTKEQRETTSYLVVKPATSRPTQKLP